jgi:hypothetical protein
LHAGKGLPPEARAQVDRNYATLLEVEPVGDDTWRLRARRDGALGCTLIDLSEFDRLGRDDYEGIQPNASCPA